MNKSGVCLFLVQYSLCDTSSMTISNIVLIIASVNTLLDCQCITLMPLFLIFLFCVAIQVHMCNKLASRHVRVGLADPNKLVQCDICENSPGMHFDTPYSPFCTLYQ
jgi:hypothetical protein